MYNLCLFCADCEIIVIYASACVLRNKMACAMKLYFSKEEVAASTSLARSHQTVHRGKTQVKTSGVGFGYSG